MIRRVSFNKFSAGTGIFVQLCTRAVRLHDPRSRVQYDLAILNHHEGKGYFFRFKSKYHDVSHEQCQFGIEVLLGLKSQNQSSP